MPGQNGQFRYGFERAEGVPDRTSTFVPFDSESMTMDRPYEPDPNLDPSGNETAGDGLKAEGSGSISGSPNSESWLSMRAHQHGFYEHTEPEADVHLWTLRDFDETEDDPVSHYIDSLFFGAWRDQSVLPSEYFGMGAKVTDFELSVDANKHVMVSHDMLYLRDRYMRKPVELAVDAAYTGDVEVRGHRQSGDENGHAFGLRVSTAGAIGVAKWKMGTGVVIASLTSVGTLATAITLIPHGFTTGNTVTVAGATPAEYNVTAVITVTGASTFTYVIVDADDVAATGTITAVKYGATEYFIVDDWTTIVDPADALVGTRREPVQVRATPQTGDLFTVGDEWRIYATAPKPVAVYSTRPKLNGTELELRFSLNSGATWITKIIDTFSLKMGTPREAKFSLGSKYAQRIGYPANAKRWWEASFGREYLDRDLEQARVSGTTISAYAKFFGAPIGATGEEDFAEFELSRMRVSQAGSTVTGPGDLAETVTMRAFSEAGSTLCIERYQNTVESIVPI